METKNERIAKSEQIIINLLGVEYAHRDIGYISNLTDSELDKAHTNVAMTRSFAQFTLFKPNFKSELINKLLVCVAWGKQDDVEKLLKTSPELMVEKTTFTDCSGRTFSNISAFEYVLWALDTRHMVNMMLNCLPKDEAGLTISNALKEQYEHFDAHGLTYTLEGKTIKEKHFDFSVLINALQTYVDKFNSWGWPERKKHWCTVVGMAQRYLPAHVIQHYCDPKTSFYPTPSFTGTLERTLKFHNWVSNVDMTWTGTSVSGDSVLGVDFGLCGGRLLGRGGGCDGRMAGGAIGAGRGWVVPVPNLLALAALCKVRTKDFNLLKPRLDNLCQNLVEPIDSNIV
jgi:hypothetical protein